MNSDQVTPLHLHTIDSLCADLISGRAIGIGSENKPLRLSMPASRSILNWYRLNRKKWSGQIFEKDVESIVDALSSPPLILPSTCGVRSSHIPRRYSLAKVCIHRFAGVQSYGTTYQPPEDYEFEPSAPITLFAGGNGSGKTSLLSAIVWCLTGSIYRPQRPPEEASFEFPCQMVHDSPDADNGPIQHNLTPVTPLPIAEEYQADSTESCIPLDTWVELTLVDQDGNLLPPLRRTQSRNNRGKLVEQPPNLDALLLDPIAVRVGTVMPALVPFIQLGNKSELGRAVSELTGLSDLLDLARHSGKARTRIMKELTNKKVGEIEHLDRQFSQHRADLADRIKEFPTMRPPGDLPVPSEDREIEVAMCDLENHLISCKTEILGDAKGVLGEGFDPTDAHARKDLEQSIGPARGELANIKRLPSAARLAKLSKLTSQEINAALDMIAQINAQATVLSELAANPPLARRKQLYARIAGWLRDGADKHPIDLMNCAVCGSGLTGMKDSLTGRLVTNHLSEALEDDTELISQTVETWAKSTLGALARDLPPTLRTELQTDLPKTPVDLIRAAIVDELFGSACFAHSLAPLKNLAERLYAIHLGDWAAFKEPPLVPLPTKIAPLTGNLRPALLRIERAIAFTRWRHANSARVAELFRAVIGGPEVTTDASATKTEAPLAVQLAALDRTVKGVAPLNAALDLCTRMSDCLSQRRKREDRLAAYQDAVIALKEVIALGSLAQSQVSDLQHALYSRTVFWLKKIYRKTQSAGHDLTEVDIEPSGALRFSVGSGGSSAPAEHITNASALRANLVAFFLAFWEYVLEKRGGLTLLVLDDPQDLLDDENRERLARALPEIADLGGQLILTTHDRKFARITAEIGRMSRLNAVEHRVVHPLNQQRKTIQTPISLDGLEAKRRQFEKNIDDARCAQDYAGEFRIFLEARLADLFDEYAHSSPAKRLTLSDYLGKIRSNVRFKASEFFQSPLVERFCSDPALMDRSLCLALLNKAHHKEKGRITYMDVMEVAEDLKRLQLSILDVSEEFGRWRRREPRQEADVTSVPIAAITPPTLDIIIHPDLAAFTNGSTPSLTPIADDERFTGNWFENKALFFIDCHNLGFAAVKGSIAIVEIEGPEIEDRRLVIALKGEEVLARRLLRPNEAFGYVALAAETPNPKMSPRTRWLPLPSMQLHRIVGILFDEQISPPKTKQEACLIEHAPSLRHIETAFRVRDDSALPLALPGQIVLGGPALKPSDFNRHEGRLAAIALEDGSSRFKRIGPALPGDLGHVRMFESIGGLGASQLIMTEMVESRPAGFPLMVAARLILGVLYRD